MIETNKRQHHVAYGYKWVGQGIIVVSEETKTIQFIYVSYINGMSQRELAKVLTEKGVPTPNGKKGWNVSTIRRILTNLEYCGNQFYPKIIEKDLFEKAQATRVETNKKVNYTDVKKRNKKIFSDKMFCSICGKTFIRHSRRSLSKNRVDWMCPDYLNEEAQCNSGYIDEEDLERVFTQLVNNIGGQGAVHLRPSRRMAKKITAGKLEKILERQIKNQDVIKDTNELKGLIQRVANHYYERANMDGRLYSYNKIKKYFDNRKNKLINEFDERLFEMLVEKIIVYPNSRITFLLKTGIQRTMKFNQQPKRKSILIDFKKRDEENVF